MRDDEPLLSALCKAPVARRLDVLGVADGVSVEPDRSHRPRPTRGRTPW